MVSRAKHYISVGGSMYAPGEMIPDLTGEQWARLHRDGAIEDEIDPVEVAISESGEGGEGKKPDPEPEQAEELEPEPESEPETEMEPELSEDELPDVSGAVVDAPAAQKRGRGGKGVSADVG